MLKTSSIVFQSAFAPADVFQMPCHRQCFTLTASLDDVTMDKILYYPYINLPKTDWTLRTLLYYDNVGFIVPQEFFYSPDRNYEPFMLELVRNELVIPIDPLRTLDNPWEVSNPFLEFLQTKEFKLEVKRQKFREALANS